MKLSIKNLESSTLQLTADNGSAFSLAPGGSLDVDVSKSISVELAQTFAYSLSTGETVQYDAQGNRIKSVEELQGPIAPVVAPVPYVRNP